MNHFQYTVTMNEISNLKTKKAKREMLDRLYISMTPQDRWGKSIQVIPTDIIELSLLYKCVWKILTENGIGMYASKLDVTVYLTATFLNLEAKLLAECLRTNQSREFVDDAFQFRFQSTDDTKPDYQDLGISEHIFKNLPSDTGLLIVNSLRDSL